ncbi:hypothetical protein PtA15_11A234 [Puccinia triticina]|uniref:Uncharacterized protein n=1 Tax=Puccinia triticina TaxID=208348 RepID=A0ABY7CX60_9BASI|nr:uncharacterized protein PtA15_11A234 [Puccinia triticina]WAQ89545.1 hypothetical protein PtA15_11A234 [Puccinia triticina]
MLEDPQLVILVRSLAPPPLAPDSQILQEQLQVGSESKRNYFGVYEVQALTKTDAIVNVDDFVCAV